MGKDLDLCCYSSIPDFVLCITKMQIFFLVLPSHIGGGEKIACSRDWQLEGAQGVLMCSEPDTS